MFNFKSFAALMVLLIIVVAAGSAMAGAEIAVNDHSSINLGYRLQTYWQSYDTNLDEDSPGYETMTNFKLRRARFRLKGNVNEKVFVFFQTDVSGKDMKMIDAFVTYKASPWFNFYMGRNMAPSSRQATTTSGALMALDRPLQTANALNWGAGGGVLNGIPATPDAVRDNGLTLFGSGPVGDNSLKYYLGIYNGVQDATSVDDKDHFTFRAQYNLWDAEAGYYNSSNYLGKKKTLGIGFSYDTQSSVGSSAAATPGDPNVLVDYTMMAADLFLELPNSKGNALTAEFGWNSLDFGDTVDFMANQGTGYYGQAGYYLASGFQPWFLYEAFSSDAADNADGNTPGSYTAFRVGATYYIDGQHANVKLAYQSRTSDVPMDVGGTEEDTVNTITLGFFTTY